MKWPHIRIIALSVLYLFAFATSCAKTFSIMVNPVQYDGEYKDLRTPLLYLKARYLNQNLGMAYFITHDYGEAREQKVLFDGDYNAFAANPIQNKDPSGHSKVGVEMKHLAEENHGNNILSLDSLRLTDIEANILQDAASMFEQAELSAHPPVPPLIAVVVPAPAPLPAAAAPLVPVAIPAAPVAPPAAPPIPVIDNRGFDTNTGNHIVTGTPYNPRGFDINRNYRTGGLHDPNGFDWRGYHTNGTRYDNNGLNRDGFNGRHHHHPVTGTYYAPNGYDRSGLDRYGLDDTGASPNGDQFF